MNGTAYKPVLLGCLCVGVLVGLALSRSGVRSVQHTNVFVLCVSITFHERKSLEAFLLLFAPYAHFVKAHEMATLSYILMQSDKDPLRIQILERYKRKEDYLTTHRSSPEFLAFRAKMQAMVESKDISSVDGHSYIESAAHGFV